MTPSIRNERFKMPKMNVKRLWHNLTAKEKVESKTEYVFDSIPDYLPESKASEDSAQNTNKHNAYDSDEEFTEKKEKRQFAKNTKSKNKNNEKDGSSPQINYYINSEHGKLHIGPETIITQNYICKQVLNPKSKKQDESMPAEIRDIQDEKLDINHIEFLSNHFGEGYREIGVKLGLTKGQMDIIKQNCEGNLKNIAREIMNVWIRQNGKKATVGKFCEILWESKIRRAREAVKMLSERVEDFN